MGRKITALITAALIGFTLTATRAEAAPNPDPDAFPKMTECQQEDSRQCGWDAVHMGDGFGDSFLAPPAGLARVYYNHAPVHRWLYGSWEPVPNSQIGNRVDLINGGSRLVGDKTIWSVGPTSYWAWPGQDRIDYQIGTS